MIEIPLTQGQVTIVDDVDADLAGLGWYAFYAKDNQKYYAVRTQTAMLRRKTVRLHRVILSRMLGRDLSRYEQVDHENLNTLDNRRKNLRLASVSENQSNKTKYTNNTSGYKGVSWTEANQKWRATIRIKNRKIHLGYFDNIEDAAEAYRLGAIQYHGEFARWEEPTQVDS